MPRQPVGAALRGASPRAGFLLVFLVLWIVYLATASYAGQQSVDARVTSYSAWSLGERQTFDLADIRETVQINRAATGHTFEVGDRLYTNRYPGAMVLGAPFYAAKALFTDGATQPSLDMGGVAAATMTALAMATLYLVFRKLSDPATAAVGAAFFGIATPTWSVSADALWPHGPAQLFIALGLLAAAHSRYYATGFVFGLSVLTRPHLGIAAAGLGIAQSGQRRSWGPAVRMAVTGLVGVALWLLYGRLLFGHWTLYGGFSDAWIEQRLLSRSPGGILHNLAMMAVHPLRGVLVYAPFLVWLALGAKSAWREGPAWVRSSAVAGVVYYATQGLEHWTGGDAYWSFRYPIEAITLLAPLGFLAFTQLSTDRRRIVLILVGLAVLIQIPGAVLEWMI